MKSLKKLNSGITDKIILDRPLLRDLQARHVDGNENYFSADFEIRRYVEGLELRKEHLHNKSILDLGSSDHFFDEYCQKKYNTKVISLDIDIDSLGKKHELGVVSDARKLPFKDEAFDLVVSNASMPHLFAPYRDDNDEVVPIEGEVEKNAINDILNVFKEAYRVVKKGGQVRMSTFSEQEIRNWPRDSFTIVSDDGNEKEYNGSEDVAQMIDRVLLVKKALNIFEKKTGAKCFLKETKNSSLIIIMK